MAAPGWFPFTYREFHDVPRVLIVKAAQGQLLLDCPFDDALDDYPSEHTVYRLPDEVSPKSSDWTNLARLGTPLGRIPVAAVIFDPSRRGSVLGTSLQKFT